MSSYLIILYKQYSARVFRRCLPGFAGQTAAKSPGPLESKAFQRTRRLRVLKRVKRFKTRGGAVLFFLTYYNINLKIS